MDEPIVSVITPVKNLVENGKIDDFNLLLSLLELQTYPNIEFLVIDGGSTDDTIELLKDLKNKDYLNFYSEKDTGKYNALNKGIMRAKGKYVTFLSCDDFIHDITAIYDIVNILETENADFTFAPAYCRHPEGFTFLFVPSMFNCFQVMPCARQAMFFRKSMLEKENYFDEKYKIMAEFDMIIKIMLKKYKGIFFDTNYVTYKLSDKSYENPKKVEEETKLLYFKNYRNLYPLNEQTLNKMVSESLFPRGLLEKLATRFVPEDAQIFYQKCEQMHRLRVQAMQMQADQQAQKQMPQQ